MLVTRYLVSLSACSAVLLTMGCVSNGGGTVTPTNQPPTISFSFSKLAVVRGTPVNLSVDVSDPDQDKLTITWSITRGALTPANSSHTIMTWSTPSTVGADTVHVSVTDGTFKRSVTAVVEVGWPATTTDALAVYEKAKSPYIIAPPPASPIVSVGEMQTSVIEPGTTLYIDTQGASIDVVGTLRANGTADQPVVIRPNDRTFQCGGERGWWKGIHTYTFSNGFNTYNGLVDFHHTQIWYGDFGIRIGDGATARLADCTLRCNGTDGILMEGHGGLLVADSEISNGKGDGIAVSSLTQLPDSVYVHGCDISINANNGMSMNLDDRNDTSLIVVLYNKFNTNFTSGISLANQVFPHVHFNEFTGNGLNAGVLNVYIQDGFPSDCNTDCDTLDMTCNYWGSVVTKPSTIESTIRDKFDGNVGTKVFFDPWLNTSPLPPNPPPTCTPPNP